MPWRGIVVGRIEAIYKIAEKALNCMGNSAFFEGFGFRGLPKFTRAVGGPLSQELETPYQAETIFKKPTVNS